MRHATHSPSHLPEGVGIGFKAEHFDDLTAQKRDLAFIEIHAENYMAAGGPAHRRLERLREDYALSVHGVGLSIGGAGPLDGEHLTRLAGLCDRYQPESFSEHLAWSSHDTTFLNDLLPLPYTEETLAIICEHIDAVQTRLRRQMLLENPSTYVAFAQSTLEETQFLREIVARTGCGLLLDVNNVFVSATNHGLDARAYLADFPFAAVGEIHLGGHDADTLPDGAPLLIDAHGSPVADPVWTLYAEVVAMAGRAPTLIEWDNDVPDFAVLMAEAERAGAVLARHRASGGRHVDAA
ncbi:MAG: MNIO family bufferin maturase [Salinarimonas sp.]